MVTACCHGDSLSTQYKWLKSTEVDLNEVGVLLSGVDDGAVEHLVELEEQALLSHTG